MTGKYQADVDKAVSIVREKRAKKRNELNIKKESDRNSESSSRSVSRASKASGRSREREVTKSVNNRNIEDIKSGLSSKGKKVDSKIVKLSKKSAISNDVNTKAKKLHGLLNSSKTIKKSKIKNKEFAIKDESKIKK